MYSVRSAPLNSRTVFSALSVPMLYNASLLVASSVKRIKNKRAQCSSLVGRIQPQEVHCSRKIRSRPVKT
jgi:hypothetical protein